MIETNDIFCLYYILVNHYDYPAKLDYLSDDHLAYYF